MVANFNSSRALNRVPCSLKFADRATDNSARSDGAESVLKLTGTPAAIIFATGATRPVPRKFPDGQ